MSGEKILILELWGLGDLTFTTPFIGAALEQNEVHLLAKSYARELLQPSYPALKFWSYDAPWTRYVGKYNLFKWNWIALLTLIFKLRREKFEVAVSVRNDPRDHLFMWLIGARKRCGYPRLGTLFFLTQSLIQRKQHRMEDWLDIGHALGFKEISPLTRLKPEAYSSSKIDDLFQSIRKPVICLHAGARIAVRRWPEVYFSNLIVKLREHFDFHLILIPDPDGYGSTLVEQADTLMPNLSIHELVNLLGRIDLLLCNDSGPGHIAAGCFRPVIALFGPTAQEFFRPWGENHKVVIRDICALRPCKDYCKFPEPYCMTKLMPEAVWPEIEQHIKTHLKNGVLPMALMKSASELSETSL